MVSEPFLWPSLPSPVVAGKSVQQTLNEIRAILELQLLKHESTVDEYAKQFEAILPYAPISNATAIKLFVLGLRSEIRNAVLDFNPSSLTSAISFACLHEKSAKKVNQESKNAKVDVLKPDQVASCPNDSSLNDNITVGGHARNNELVAEAKGTLKDDDKGEEEGMTDLEVHETDSQEDEIHTGEYGRLEQRESKILYNADLERIEGEYDAVSNLIVDVAKETYEIHALKVKEADNVAANVTLINDVIVEEEKCVRIKNWSKTQAMQEWVPPQYDLLHREGHNGFYRCKFLSFPRRRFFFANRLMHFQPIQGLHKNAPPLILARMSFPRTAMLHATRAIHVPQPSINSTDKEDKGNLLEPRTNAQLYLDSQFFRCGFFDGDSPPMSPISLVQERRSCDVSGDVTRPSTPQGFLALPTQTPSHSLALLLPVSSSSSESHVPSIYNNFVMSFVPLKLWTYPNSSLPYRYRNLNADKALEEPAEVTSRFCRSCSFISLLCSIEATKPGLKGRSLLLSAFIALNRLNRTDSVNSFTLINHPPKRHPKFLAKFFHNAKLNDQIIARELYLFYIDKVQSMGRARKSKGLRGSFVFSLTVTLSRPDPLGDCGVLLSSCYHYYQGVLCLGLQATIWVSSNCMG